MRSAIIRNDLNEGFKHITVYNWKTSDPPTNNNNIKRLLNIYSENLNYKRLKLELITTLQYNNY